MITMFCDFRQFSAKNWRFSKKPMLWSKFCIIYLCFESKRQFFRWIFRRKYFLNHNIGPRFGKKNLCLKINLYND
jgi:hypothetical protein